MANGFGSSSEGGNYGLFDAWMVAGVVVDVLVGVCGLAVDRGSSPDEGVRTYSETSCSS